MKARTAAAAQVRQSLPGRDPQRASWKRRIAVFDERYGETRQMTLFPEDRHEAQGKDPEDVRVAFIAYCLHVALKTLLAEHAPGLTPRQALAKLAAIQMLDVHFPTTDGRELIFSRFTP